ncbi:TonB-dependent receptor [Pseudidiomarina gelatinasegens]|uniref:TonB-dependent receptor n=1 Tax=Pseudidiomarina gelatinasegens TaxID=2487740 RepID=A0A443YXS1_9GAMM|nr:TonB-dependent receptor [Pseudidiomarina gelatinasegens]RWU08828.1 TonB-dependent receptor [Pseudidiomarina gelatinasegens]
MKLTAIAGVVAGVVSFIPQSTLALPQDVNEAEVNQQETVMETITVVAHRQPRQLSEVAGTVSIISEEDLQRNLVINAADLVRYQPGVDLDDDNSRFGNSGFRIRGIGGNRTAVVIDQVPVADHFSVGSYSNTGRGLLELGLASRVEILRGPASTMYGSKALGGVVAVHLLDAQDVLRDGKRGSRLQGGLHSDSHRANITGATAFADGGTSLLLAGALQYGEDVRSADLSAEKRDAQHRRQQAILLRAATDTQFGEWQFTLDALNESRDTDIQSIIGSGRLAATTSLIGDDSRQQHRLLGELDMAPLGWVDRGSWRIYYQASEIEQDSFEQRMLLPEPLDIERLFDFEQVTAGVGADLESDAYIAGTRHRIGYGFELASSTLEDQRDAAQTNLTTGVTTKTLLGETFPLRDFPRSRVTELGIYIHDEFQLWNDGPVVSPGLRYEHYRLRTQDDALFAERYPNSEVTDLTHDAWLPKLGVIWSVTDNSEWFAQYARGYRAPPFSDVNIGLYYPQFNVLAIANPDLKAERGYAFETGFRGRDTDSSWSLTAYHNRYSEFIQSRASLGFDPVRQLLIFQSINREKVVIEGIEGNWEQRWNSSWSTAITAEYSRGEDRESGRDIADVAPPRVIAELQYQSSTWDTRLIATAVRGQRELFDESDAPLFSTPGYATIDWLSSWYLNDDLNVTVGLFNLTDRKYWRNARVSGLSENDPSLPVLAEAGRSIGFAAYYRF